MLLPGARAQWELLGNACILFYSKYVKHLTYTFVSTSTLISTHWKVKLIPTIPTHRHRVFLFSVGTFLILFCSRERPAFHRPGRRTYWTHPHSWQVAGSVPACQLSAPPSHPAGISTLPARPPPNPRRGPLLGALSSSGFGTEFFWIGDG